MSYRSILVQAESGDHALGRLSCAADLADRFDANLIGLGAESVAPVTLDQPFDSYSAQWVIAMRDMIEADLRAAEDNFRRSCGGERKQWIARRIMPGDAMAQAARAADLIVAGGSTTKARGVYRSASVAELLAKTGRPVLVAPSQGGRCVAKEVVLAWKDTREARRAMTDAIPMMQGADDVVVLELCAHDELTSALERTAEVAAALGLHGINARNEAQVVTRSEITEALLDHATLLGADLIVAGGYGHSRLGEWAFGGVTRDLLDQDERFVLLSH